MTTSSTPSIVPTQDGDAGLYPQNPPDASASGNKGTSRSNVMSRFGLTAASNAVRFVKTTGPATAGLARANSAIRGNSR